jgi:hypothetical protein
MKKKLALVSILMIGSILLGACTVAKDLSVVAKLGNEFMTGLRDSQYEQTWNMLAPSLQTELGTYEAWVNFATPRTFDKWSFSNTKVENNQAQIDGECSLGSDAYTLTLIMDKINEVWKISGINIAAK